MNTRMNLDRRQFLRTAGETAATLAAASAWAPVIPSAESPARTIGIACIGLGNCIRSPGNPKCATDEAFVETPTFLISLKSYQQKRVVRVDSVKEEIV